MPIFWDQELDRLTARDTGEEITQLRLTFVGDDWGGYATHVHIMDATHRTSGSTSENSSCRRQRGRCTRLPRSRAPVQLGLFNYPVQPTGHHTPYRRRRSLWL